MGVETAIILGGIAAGVGAANAAGAFNGPEMPKAPKVPEVPDRSDAADAAKKVSQDAANRFGRRKTILTLNRDVEDGEVARKDLLGLGRGIE